jgi:hypothetical protein
MASTGQSATKTVSVGSTNVKLDFLASDFAGNLPGKPDFTVATSGTRLTLSWSANGASGYTLYYAPYPNPETIGSFDLKNQTSVIIDLWHGAAFYVAVEAYNPQGKSQLSAIKYFIMP